MEYKFLAPNSVLDDIRADLGPYVVADAVAAQQRPGEYTVRSIYFDTPRLECLDAKLDGLKIRNKFRIRGYDQPVDGSVVFLEIKKNVAGFIEKHRAPLLRKDLEQFLASPDLDKYIIRPSGKGRELRDAERFLYHYYRDGLLPTALVVYDREPFASRFDSALRITFDKAVRGSAFPTLDTLYDEHCLKLAMPNTFVFEVKFFRRALPGFIRSIVTRYHLPRMALSKYAICLDSPLSSPVSSRWRERLCAAASRS